MRTTVSLSTSCRKNVFLLKFSNKNTFFPHKMAKLTVVLMSIKRLNKKRRPLMPCSFTGPKMFFAGPHFFRQTKNGFTYCASQKHFVPVKKMI